MSALRALRRFAALEAAQRRLALEALLLAVPVEASLRLIGLQKTQRWLARVVPLVARDEPATAPPEAIEKLVASAIRYAPLRGACLQLSLIQVSIERRRGHAVQMAIGVRAAPDGQYEAHAWVEPLGATTEPASFKRLWTWVP